MRRRFFPPIVAMKTQMLIDRLERKIGWIAIPGIVRIIMMFQALVFVLIQFQRATAPLSDISSLNDLPEMFHLLYLDGGKILQGEVWRLISFVALPPTLGSLIVMIFAVFFTIFLGNMLEEIWGSFRLTLYVIGGIIGTVLGSFVFPAFGVFLLGVIPTNGVATHFLLGTTLLFACAVYNPHHTIMLFGIIPIKMFWLALFSGGMLVIDFLSGLMGGLPAFSIALLLSVSNFLVVFVPGFKKSMQMRSEIASRRKKFESAQLPEAESMHRCAMCGKTEQDDAEAVFRVSSDDEEYCDTCREKRNAAAEG